MGENSIHTNPEAAETDVMLTLVLREREQPETRIHCRRTITLLGSRQGCKVRMHHGLVSPVHVAIVNTGSEVHAIDLVSRHGTFLNGLRMEHERLSDGDVLRVRPWEFHVEIQESVRPEDADVHMPLGLEPAPDLLVLEHTESKRVFKPTRDLCVIGRSNGCDIALTDNAVSRAHAVLFAYHGHPAIFDLLSKNQTLVNDEPAEFRILKNEDIITIGESSFRVRLAESAVIKRASHKKQPIAVPVSVPEDDRPVDLIDIQATEGSQRWRIAENAEKATRKR